MLADLPDFVRADTMDGADAASAAASAAGPWITADGDASPTLQDAWRKDAARAQAAASRPSPASPQPPADPPQPAAAPAQDVAPQETTRDPHYDDALENMMRSLDIHLQEAQTHLTDRRPQQVGFAAGQIADAAKAFGFRVVERLARNVERAGNANDYEAISDILPELRNAIERTRIALRKER